MSPMILAVLVLICAFVAVLFALFFFGGDGDQKDAINRRLMRPSEEGGGDVDITKRRRQQGGLFAAAFRSVNLINSLEKMMWQAGIYARVVDILLMMVLLFGAAYAAGQVFVGDNWMALGMGAAAASLPIFYIRFMRSRRLKAFAAQLPFALDLIKSSLEAGHSLGRALQVLIGEFAEPLGGEFRTVLEQTRIGLPLGRALDDMLQRVPEDDLKLLVVAVKVQSEVGSSLAAIVGRLSDIVRTRQRLRLQIKALTAQSRMGGMIVGLLPVIVMGIFSMIQPGYIQSLFYDSGGQMILKIAIGCDIMALITIRRLLRVDF
jgi:tight adherence protein B